MASVVIRKTWFSRPNVGVLATVPTSGVGPPQKSEATWKAGLAPWLQAGTRTTQAAGAVTVGNVVSSTPPGGTTQAAGSKIDYLVSV